jgi:fucose permease
MVVVSISCNLIPVCLPLLGHGLKEGALSNEQLGRVAAMTFVGLCTGILIAGPLGNRYPAKVFTLGGCLLVAMGLALLGFADTYVKVLLGVGVLGCGGGMLDMILSPVVCATKPKHRTVALNWLHSFYCVGAVLTTLAATIAFSWNMDWQALALWMTVPPLIVAILFLSLPLPALLSETGNRTKVRQLFHERFYLFCTAAIFLGGAAEMGAAQWLPAFAELDLGFGRAVGGASLLIFSLAMALGRMVVGALNNRVSIYLILAWGCGSTTLLFLIAGFCPNIYVALAACILAGFTGSCLWPSILGLAADRYPLAGTSMFGMLTALGNFGGIVVPWMIGTIADRSSIAIGIAATAICPLLMLASLWGMHLDRAPTTSSLKDALA